MKCEEFEDLILDDLDGRLVASQRIPVAAHLAECSDCRAFLAVQVELDHTLTARPKPQLSEDFRARIITQIRSQIRTQSGPVPGKRSAVPWSLLGNLAGVASVSAAGALASQSLPYMLPGMPWAVATVILAAGIALIAELETPLP